jgi:DNA-directed RNA polymerase subunit RPC12/RpoP
MKTCPNCHEQFEPEDKKRIYCTEKCKRIFNAKKYVIKQKKYSICPNCGKKFEHCHGKKKYCSDFCCRQYNTKRRAGKVAKFYHKEGRPFYICSHCKYTFRLTFDPIVEYTKMLTLLCPKCGKHNIAKDSFYGIMDKYQKISIVEEKEKKKIPVCPNCGKKIITKYAQQKYCNDLCKERFYRERNKKEADNTKQVNATQPQLSLVRETA